MGGQDVRWSEEHVLAGKKFANKIWNASRFVLKQTEVSGFQLLSSNPFKNIKPQTTADKKLLKELKTIKQSIEKLLGKYEFGQALHELYDFFWHQFCDTYLEAAKKQ